MADVVFPSAASWCETDGTVTNSERRVQRVRKALDPPGEARDDMWIIAELARRLGHDWPEPVAEEVWDELRSLSPMHAGMSYARLEEHGGLQWPCPDESHPGSPILHERLWAGAARRPARAVLGRRGPRPVRGARRRVPDPAHDRPPARVVQHRRADEPLQLAAPPRRVARSLARGRRAARARRRRDRARVVAPRLGRGAAADRPVAAARARVHDLPLPGSGRHEPAHDRRHRSEVGHGGVQGRRDPGREARAGRARGARRRRRAGHRRRAGSSGSPPRSRRGADGGRERRARPRARRRPRRLGRRRAPARARGQHRQHGARRPRATPPAAAGALGAAGADRLDQPRRAQRALPPPDDPARRRLRRRHVLRDARRRAAAARASSTSARTSPAAATAPTS